MLITGNTFTGFWRGRVEIQMHQSGRNICIDIDQRQFLMVPVQSLEISGMAMPRPRITVEFGGTL